MTATLRDSQVTGNGTVAPSPIDVLTPKRPRLRSTVCDHSLNAKTSQSWGVCSAD